MRFIIRPDRIGKTPRRLKTALGARNTIKISECIGADTQQDIFLAYPPSNIVANADDGYHAVREFYSSSKYRQRALMHDTGIPVVPTQGLSNGIENYTRFVVRPHRHSQGRDYRLTDSQADYDPRTHYLSGLVPKDREYRALFYRGRHVCTYLKYNPQGIPSDQPWTHANGTSFQTIQNPRNDPLQSLGLIPKLQQSVLTQHASLIAYDVLLAGSQLYVCEANLCPGITIQGTVDKIVAIQEGLSQ